MPESELDFSLLIFDHILVERRPGSYNLLDVLEFANMSIEERIALILGGKVRFMNGDEVVPIQEAVKNLRDVIRSSKRQESG